jgi:hypothetical protein
LPYLSACTNIIALPDRDNRPLEKGPKEELMNLRHKTSIKLIILLTLAFYASTCGDHYKIKQTVFPDGSLDRTIEWTTSQNNPEMEDILSPLPAGSTWTVIPKGRKNEKTLMGRSREVWIYQASKTFPSVEELNREFESGKRVCLAPRAEFKKRFRGVFIHYTYRETYPSLKLFKNNPASKYFSPEEMKLIEDLLEDETGKENEIPEDLKKEIEKKSEIWMRETLFREFFSLLLNGTTEADDPTLTREQILNQKEEIFTYYSEFTRDDMFKVSLKDFLAGYAETRNQPSFSLLWTRSKAKFIAFEKDLKAIDEALLDLYTHHISMPGQILSANGQSFTKKTATWEIPFLILIFRDAVMEVESRRFNWWLPGLGIPFLILVLFGFFAVLRHQKSG